MVAVYRMRWTDRWLPLSLLLRPPPPPFANPIISYLKCIYFDAIHRILFICSTHVIHRSTWYPHPAVCVYRAECRQWATWTATNVKRWCDRPKKKQFLYCLFALLHLIKFERFEGRRCQINSPLSLSLFLFLAANYDPINTFIRADVLLLLFPVLFMLQPIRFHKTNKIHTLVALYSVPYCIADFISHFLGFSFGHFQVRKTNKRMRWSSHHSTKLKTMF